MSLWEYKVITSGKGGFATPAMLEKFLNDLGRDEWEIIQYHSVPDNLLAFTGLARRSTQRDWTLADAAAAAAKAEAEKLRAEFAAKFEAATRPAPASGAAEAPPASFIEEKSAPDDGFRKPVDTSRDDDPEAHEEPKDDWDKLTASEEEELPVFFDAIKPHLRRNQRGPGMSVGTDYLAKKWDQSEEDIKGALVECGFVLPADEDSKAEYVEYDGDLYWLNINRRGELWINTKEKPRPVFRNVKATRVEQPAEEPKPEPSPAADQPSAKPHFEPRARREERREEAHAAAPSAGPAETVAGATDVPASGAPATPAPDTSGVPLPSGAELLNKIRPHMRRNRRGPGGSGSATFLARALRRSEADITAAFTSLGLFLPPNPNDKPLLVEFGNEIWWLNQDSRGGVWINGRDKRDGEVIAPAAASGAPVAVTAEAPAAAGTETAPTPMPETTSESAAIAAPVAEPIASAPAAPAADPAPVIADAPVAQAPAAPAPATNNTLAAVRLLMKETRTGGFAGKLDRVADELGKSPDDLTAALVGAGLKVPEKAKEKPVFVEHAGEIFWFNKNAKDELWLNAKASKFADKDVGEEETEGEGDDKKPARRGGGGRSRKKGE
ncbi:MAG: DUF4177 domain-containing protein [Verrucomicrobia bacterium]|nr:DUF4177 domain-containing protein [Verrucomicrobiota bacterium]